MGYSNQRLNELLLDEWEKARQLAAAISQSGNIRTQAAATGGNSTEAAAEGEKSS